MVFLFFSLALRPFPLHLRQLGYEPWLMIMTVIFRILISGEYTRMAIIIDYALSAIGMLVRLDMKFIGMWCPKPVEGAIYRDNIQESFIG
jgi:hypothetical protein